MLSDSFMSPPVLPPPPIQPPDDVQIPGRPFSCAICKYAFKRRAHLVDHQRIHSGEKPYTCEFCLTTFSRKSTMLAHSRLHSGVLRYVCHPCGALFATRNLLQRHRGTGKGCAMAESLKGAPSFPKAEKVTPDVFSERYKPVPPGAQSWRPRCPICDMTFSSKACLKKHRRVHSNIRPFKCKNCPKAFKQRSDLGRHQRVHTGEKPYKCDICNKAFAEKGAVAPHRKVHTGEKPFQCDLCGRFFRQKIALKIHRATHFKTSRRKLGLNMAMPLPDILPFSPSPIQNDPSSLVFSPSKLSESPVVLTGSTPSVTPQSVVSNHLSSPSSPPPPPPPPPPPSALPSSVTIIHTSAETCDICLKSFPDPRRLKQHRRSHLPKSRPFMCQCGARFNRRAHLTDHERIHTGEKPFQCPFCSKSFAYQRAMVSHRRAQHEEESYTLDMKHRLQFQKDREVPPPPSTRSSPVSSASHRSRSSSPSPPPPPPRSSLPPELEQTELSTTQSVELSEDEDDDDDDSDDDDDEDDVVTIPQIELPASPDDLDCKICVLRFDSQAKLVEHLYTHMDKRYACSLCQSSFLAEADLLAHVYALHAHA
uniref:Zinc finger protein 62 homolog n=1 Tax=Hirondellea gigas TaxID=1518452 RepID=A0A6A7G4H9_9CRUS